MADLAGECPLELALGLFCQWALSLGVYERGLLSMVQESMWLIAERKALLTLRPMCMF